MEVKGKDGRFEIRTNNHRETLTNIAIAIIMASYELARPYGLGFMRANETKLTRAMALQMLLGEDISHDYASNPNKPNQVYMDYVFGRCCKTFITIEKDVVKISISTIDRKPYEILKRAEELLNEMIN